MYTRWLLVGSVIYLVVVAFLDLVYRPEFNLPILYAAPVLIAAFTESTLLVGLMAALVLTLDLISVWQAKPPLESWSLTFVSLLVVCYLALQVAGQRAFIRRNVEEAARVRWNELLLSSVAHELRTPLTVILGYAQMLERNPNLPGPLHGTVAAIERSAAQMRATIDDLAQRWKRGGEG
jgi:signal transduction histidine kinase